MPVRATTTVDIREEIALMALSGAYTISELAELFEITRPTIYKYRERYRAGGRSDLVDQRRAPRHPRRTPEALVQRIVAERRRWGWGSKKIRRRLLDAEPERAWPARSTIDEISSATSSSCHDAAHFAFALRFGTATRQLSQAS
jgi:putative transposase